MVSPVLRSVFYYRRVNVIVALAVAISTAAIGGAMIVGDSVRHSLRQMTRLRLGKVTHVVHGRFVREQLAADIAEHSGAMVAPAVTVSAGMELQQQTISRRVGSVTVTGVDRSAWNLLDTADTSVPVDNDIVLGFRTARELGIRRGDSVSVWVELPSAIPRDSLLGEREEISAELQFVVRDILPETAGASRFTLNPGQQLAKNAFVSLHTLQERLEIQATERSRRNLTAKPALVNTLLIHGNAAEIADGRLHDAVSESVTMADLALRVRVDTDRGYVSVETDRMILEPAVAKSIAMTADQLGLNTASTLVYLINEFAAEGRDHPDERYSMYAIVAGLPHDADPPLGLIGGQELSEDGIILSEWLRDDLEVETGDWITARWHEVGSHGERPEIKMTFRVDHVFSADDSVSIDQGLTPTIPGVTDVESFSDWNQPFEMETNRITARDDAWWAEHRATPKAFVSLETAQKLWSSRFGQVTSIRIAADIHPLPADRLRTIADKLSRLIPSQCDLAAIGLAPTAVLESGLRAANGANDFTQLFSGFSFFLILSAIILTSLMFRLGIQQRVSQAGLLHSVGLPPGAVRWFFLGEGLLVALAGAVLGAFLAVGFAKLMVYGLTTWWIGAIGTQDLQLEIRLLRLLTAALISLVLATAVVRVAVAGLRHLSVRQLLNGMTSERPGFRRSSGIDLITVVSLLTGILLPAVAAGGLLPGGEAFSGLTWNMVAFFVGGISCLIGGLLLLRQRLQAIALPGDERMVRNLSGFAVANAARSPWRSLMTTALIASATFLIVAVAAGRRNPQSETPDIESGNGGFRLVAESSQPILQDINSPEGRVAVNLEDAYAEAGLEDVSSIYSFAVRPGEDASCVNLYQTHLPTLLGASDGFIERGGFRFADTPGANPWTLLQDSPDSPDSPGQLPLYPVIGDMNTLRYSLKKNIGDVIPFPDDQNPTAGLQVAGMLDGSLFQGVLVMTRANLQELDPGVTGYEYFLAETHSAGQADALAVLLESRLNSSGMDTESVGDRMAGFLAVQNTYLATFQLLGGLGLLVGIFGLAVVMVRNVVERRGEIAMLRAIGFTGFRICRLILIENSVLLFWGMLLGTTSALLAMLPHLRSTGGDLPWQSLGITLVTVAVTGMLASVAAVRSAQQVSIRDNLTVET
ncbi:MAG: ABC transporter permease [Fuerstiella sp.]|nr:ABC transporter permease [Fuerstiella sp.]